MALNYSHRPIFPAHLAEENLVQGGSQDKDIRELLPADPFGMDISSTVTAITGWLEDLGADYSGYGGGEVGVSKGDFPLFAGWNFWWNTEAMEFQTFPGNKKFDDRRMRDTRVDGFYPEELGCSVYDRGVQFACTLDGAKFGTTANASFDWSGNHGKNAGFTGYLWEEALGHPVYDGGVRFACTLEGAKLGTVNASLDRVDNHGTNTGLADTDDSSGAPHPAMSFALAYLGVRDLLSVERVCKSLRYTVQNDPLLWRSIHIDKKPLNDGITDDILLHLTSRAQGSLQCLSLVECQQVTDDGLKRVLDGNPRLTKLSVPGCTRISIDSVVSSLRAFKTVAVNGIKSLRVGGLYGVTQQHFDELMSLLDIRNHVQVNRHKPHFYHRGSFYLPFEDDRPIDIETCPRCQNLRLVYDCPAEECQGKDHTTELCRACTLCIPRCVLCGKCINDGEYEETFCLELICIDDCLEQELQCQEISVHNHAVPQEPVTSFDG